jgi:hypothetical protein
MIKPAPSRRCGVDAALRSILTRNPSMGFQRSFIRTAQVAHVGVRHESDYLHHWSLRSGALRSR